MDFFKQLFIRGKKRVLGIDIGASSVKVVELEGGAAGARLTNYAVVQSSDVRLFEAHLEEYVRYALMRCGARAREAVVALPTTAVFSTVLDLPPMPEKEISQALQFKARQYIPLPISSVSLDWVRVADHKVLLLAIPHDLIKKYTALCASWGLTVRAFEVEGMSLARLFSEPLLVIDMGSRSTGLFIVDKNMLMLMGQSDFSGSALTQHIALNLGISVRSAEEVKRERGMVRGGGGDELSTLFRAPVDGILTEAGRLRDQFVFLYGKDVRGIVLTGGGAHMPGFADYAAHRLELPYVSAEPFLHIAHVSGLEASVRPLNPDLMVAAGAALRNL